MNTTSVAEPLVDEDEDVIVVPHEQEFVACMTCRHRSYVHFFFREDLMSFCGHHGTKGEERLLALGASILADYRDTLLGENRQQGEP